MEKLLDKLHLYRLPFWVKLFWAKCFIRMFRGFGKTYYDDLILFVELDKWIASKGKPTTTNSNYLSHKIANGTATDEDCRQYLINEGEDPDKLVSEGLEFIKALKIRLVNDKQK